MNRTLTTGIVMAVFLLEVSAALGLTDGGLGYAGGPGGQHAGTHRGDHVHDRRGDVEGFLIDLLLHAKTVGLTDGQVATLKAIQLDLDLMRVTVETDIMLTEHEIAGMVDDDRAEISAIEAKIRLREAREAALRVAAVKAKRAATALLLPAQREKARILFKQTGHSRDEMPSIAIPEKVSMRLRPAGGSTATTIMGRAVNGS